MPPTSLCFLRPCSSSYYYYSRWFYFYSQLRQNILQILADYKIVCVEREEVNVLYAFILFFPFGAKQIIRGYHTMVRRYEFYVQVTRTINFIFPIQASMHVLFNFCLLYKNILLYIDPRLIRQPSKR